MNDSERNKLIEKIRKVMALSSSPNEAEAAAAAEKAQAMLAEYNLSMADISTEEAEEDFIEDREEVTESVPWRRQIANNVAELYFCSYFFTHRKDPTSTRACGYIRRDIHSFIGAQHNVAVAKMMFKYLCDAVDRMSIEGSMRVTIGERSAYRTSFKWACSLRLSSRIRDRIAAAKRGEIKAESGANLPALLDLYTKTQQQLQVHIEKKVGKLRHTKTRPTQTHLGGALDGQRAGDKIGLDPQVSGKAGAHLLR